MEITLRDFEYLSICVEGFLFGVYTGIFAMYLQYCASRQDASKGTNIIFFALCLLYLLSLSIMLFDFISFLIPSITIGGHILVILFEPQYSLAVTSFPNLSSYAQPELRLFKLSKSSKIYRCWIVWGYNIRIVIVPSILAFAFFAIWIAGAAAPPYIIGDLYYVPIWSNILDVTAIALSMTVNALVMGLIVFRIIKVFREINPTSDERRLGATGGSTLRSTIFVLVESGMILFSIQLVRLVLASLESWTSNLAVVKAYPFIGAIHENFTGITPTIILVRVSMGFSFHDASSMVEAAGSLRFAPTNDSNPISETGSTSNVDQERRDDNDLQFEFKPSIKGEMV